MDSVRCPWMRSAQKVKYCAVISSKRWGLTVLLKGRLWAAIMKMDAAIPVANSARATRQFLRLSR
jgi:hypothetical protein